MATRALFTGVNQNSQFLKGPGFTLIELIMTMVLVGIMAVYVVSKFSSLSSYDLENASGELVEAIRFTQQGSMHRVNESGFQIVTNDGTSDYRVQEYDADTVSTANINHPLTGSTSYTEIGDIWSSISVSNLSLSFDSRGSPCAQIAPCDVTGQMTTTQTITLTHSSGATRSVIIEPVTGYAYVN